MTHAFKRTVGLLLAVMLIFSVCTVAFADEPATELTAKDLGVTAGSHTTLYDDPVVAGNKVLLLNATETRPNFELADPTDHEKKFEPVADTSYTVKFDYYLKAETDKVDFTLYYGAQSAASSNYSKSAITGTENGISLGFAGDGKWHTAAISFTAKEVKGKVNGVADQVLPYLYLTYYAGDKGQGHTMKGYIKNIEIITEDVEVSYTTTTYDFDYYFENGAVKATVPTYSSTVPYYTTGLKLDEDGNAVFIPKSSTFNVTANKRHSSITNYPYVCLTTDSGTIPGTVSNAGNPWNGHFNIRYKVVKLGDEGWAGIGVGRSSTTTANTCLYNSIQQTDISDDWEYFTAPIQNEAAGTKIRVVLGGTNAEIAIDYVEYVYTGTNSNVGLTTYNDNGNIKIRAQYKGTSLTEKASNGFLGEESDGWCTDTALTNVTDVAVGAPVYAKYNTVVIDKFNLQNITGGWDTNGTSKSFNGNSITVSSAANAGLMLPAYDAPATVTGQGSYDYYQFASGAEYMVTIEMSGIKQKVAGGSSAMSLIGATAAGSGGARDTGINPTPTPGFTINASSADTDTMAFNFTRAAGSKGWEKCGLAIRSSADKAEYTITVEKIIITKVTEDTNYAILYNSDADADAKYTFVKLGNQVDLPAKADTDTKMFIGWYNGDTKINNASAAQSITTSHIALPAFVADEAGLVTVTPQYISKESYTVNFSEEKYGTLSKGSTDLGGAAGQFSIVTDDTVDPDYFSTDNTYLRMYNTGASNIFKTSLFKEDGSRIIVYEGVSYQIDIRYKVVTAMDPINGRTKGNIAICRNPIGQYKPDSLSGYSANSTAIVDATSTTNGAFVTASATLYNKFMYQAVSGDSSATYDIQYNNQLSIMISEGDVYVDYITVTPVSYEPSYINYDETKGTVKVDYANGKLEVIPNEGYEVSSKGVRVLMNYKDYTLEDGVVTVETNAAELLCLKTNDGRNFTFSTKYTDYAKKIGALIITVDFVETADTNAEIIAASVRYEDATGETYVSAGLRFRGRIAAADVLAAAEVGFVAVPTNALTTDIAAYMEADGSAALKGVAYSAADGKNHVYNTLVDENGDATYYDYQLLIKNLTGSVDLTSLKINVAMYITDAQGNTTYVNEVAGISYAQFANK